MEGHWSNLRRWNDAHPQVQVTALQGWGLIGELHPQKSWGSMRLTLAWAVVTRLTQVSRGLVLYSLEGTQLDSSSWTAAIPGEVPSCT